VKAASIRSPPLVSRVRHNPGPSLVARSYHLAHDQRRYRRSTPRLSAAENRSTPHSPPVQQPNAERALNAAFSLQRCGRFEEALVAVDGLLKLNPDCAIAYNFRGNVLLALERNEEAIASYNRGLVLRPDYPEALNNRGVALIRSGRYAEAEKDFSRLTVLKPADASALHSLGVSLALQGRHSEAVGYFDSAIVAGRAGAPQYKSRAQSLHRLDRSAEALADYDKALGFGDDPECFTGRGMLLLQQQRDVEALHDLSRALSLMPVDADAWLGRAIALVRLNQLEEALAGFNEALRLRPANPNALFNRATALARMKRYEEAAHDCEALLQIEQGYAYAAGLLLHSRLSACDWRGLAGLCSKVEVAVANGVRAAHPYLHLAVSDSPGANLRAAQIFAQDRYPASARPLWRDERYRHGKIRIAYLSADFYRHATAYLMAGVFERHDRAQFETVAVSYGPNDHSEMRDRLESAFDRFLDVRPIPDREIAQKLRAMEIDIAVDLKGYTGDARPGILAMRPAPVQAHYLGYPGSLGAGYIDYLFADAILIPAGSRQAFAEQIIWLPGCYQCNEPAGPDPSSPPSRSEYRLPVSAFVFCCFNSSFKVTPSIFDIWMRLLKTTPGSVLWLLESTTIASANLRNEARSRGIAPDRLIFAPLVNHTEHLARLPLADLALDTFPYGAHTTASDAVRAGLPLLTIRGESFAARVAASVVAAAGLPEMVSESPEEYETRAVALACDGQALAAVRSRLQANRGTSLLFDTARFTRHLEKAYVTMNERYQRGLRPTSFAVAVSEE
jgi:protein O-GlcNAc transferase